MDDLALAAHLAREAGELARRMRDDAQAGVVHRKGHASEIVTAADRAAEALVVRLLAEHRPDDGLIGEEGTAEPSRSGRSWVVDPVDGTLNYVDRLPTWCSAVALRDDETGEGVVAAMYAPDSRTLWTGGRAAPATVSIDGGESVPLARIRDAGLGERLLATYLHSTTTTSLFDTWARIAEAAQAIRILGSGSVDLAYVAEGRLGAVAQPDMALWDWLPGSTLVLAAGGAAAVVEHAGHRWHIAGSEQAVHDLTGVIEQ
jgi:fructose-1,6-bisphosphatase/inositol monophosphatase family enzyme